MARTRRVMTALTGRSSRSDGTGVAWEGSASGTGSRSPANVRSRFCRPRENATNPSSAYSTGLACWLSLGPRFTINGVLFKRTKQRSSKRQQSQQQRRLTSCGARDRRRVFQSSGLLPIRGQELPEVGTQVAHLCGLHQKVEITRGQHDVRIVEEYVASEHLEGAKRTLDCRR